MGQVSIATLLVPMQSVGTRDMRAVCGIQGERLAAAPSHVNLANVR
jgi:hypothetical protein